MLIFQPENLPVVQHSPSVHSYSAHTWLEASAMRTFPDDSQAVNVSHRGAEKTKRQKMPDSVHKNKDTKERNRQQDECRLKSPAQQIKKAAAKREKSYTNTRASNVVPAVQHCASEHRLSSHCVWPALAMCVMPTGHNTVSHIPAGMGKQWNKTNAIPNSK